MLYAKLALFMAVIGGFHQLVYGENFILQTNATSYQATMAYGGRRYRVSSSKLAYSDATKECENDGSVLAVIRSPNVTAALNLTLESSMLMGAVKVNPLFVHDGVWFGLKINTSKNHGVWSDGMPYNNASQYTNWAQLEPNTPNAFCVQLWRAYYWKWDDTYCDFQKYFICEDQDPKSYTPGQITSLTNSIIQLASGNVSNSSTMDKLSGQVNTLLDVDETAMQDSGYSTRAVLMAIDTIASNYEDSSGNYMKNRKNIGIEIENVTKISKRNSSGVTFGEYLGDGSSEASNVFLSNALLSETIDRPDVSDLEVITVIYRKSSLFKSENNAKEIEESNFGEGPVRHPKPTVVSHVISIDVKDVPMRDLRNPVVVRHVARNLSVTSSAYTNPNSPLDNQTSKANEAGIPVIGNVTVAKGSLRRETKLKCVYWDFLMNDNTGGWSESGCRLTDLQVTSDKAGIQVTCSCDHMTNFAVILDTSEFFEPVYLTYLTITGCVISIACLIATLLTNLYFKQLRSKLPQQILMNICVSLILLNLVFLIGIDRTDAPTFCFVTTVLLHYSVLLAWAWMLTEGVFLYKTLVSSRVGSGTGTCFIWGASAICYVLPGAIVAVQAATMNSYRSERYCWLSSTHLLFSIVIPIAVILVINFIIFFVIMYNITLRSQMFRQHLDLKKISQALRRALCMMFVLGLPWVLGYIMLLSKDDNVKIAFSVIFTIFNAFQGLAIFILYCVRQENVRNMWFDPLRKRYRSTFKRMQTRNLVSRRYTNDGTLSSQADGLQSKKKLSSVESPTTIQSPVTTPSSIQATNFNEISNQAPRQKPLPQLPPRKDKKQPFRSGWP